MSQKEKHIQKKRLKVAIVIAFAVVAARENLSDCLLFH